jgi:photosystem II stability/assembly factor-like uncharacterized protein
MNKMQISFDEYKILVSPEEATMRTRLSVMIVVVVGVCPLAVAKSPAWQPASQGLNDIQMKVIVVDPRNPRLLYVASSRAVYQSADGGRTWRERFRTPAQADVTDLAVDPFDPRCVLVATTNGLYGSFDGARRWKRLFRGPGAGESQAQVVRFHPIRRSEVFLGTAGGLFASQDQGRHWQELGGRLRDRSIHDLAIAPGQPNRLYALTDQGLFVSVEPPATYTLPAEGVPGTSAMWRPPAMPADEFQAWDRIFEVSAKTEPLEDEVEEPPEEPAQDSDSSRQLTALAIDPHQPQQLYLATAEGLLVSHDQGATWNHLTQLGLGTGQIRHLMLHAHSPSVVYAATLQGVARYDPQDQRWEVLYAGLPTQAVHRLAASETRIFAATDQGVFALDLTEEQLAQGSWPSAHEILANFVHEPTIEQVQAAAIRYAEVEPEKIQRWRRQAYLAAFFPTFNVSANPSLTDFRHWDSGTNPDSLLKGERDVDWDASLAWDVGDLIWSTDQTSIDVRSRLMVQLRDDILDEVTRHYFERRRLQVEFLTTPPTDPREQLDKELRLQELTAMLDGLTGGWFSRQLEFNGDR